MKTFYFEAEKTLLDKAYQNYACDHVMPARARVFAADEASALEMAEKKLHDKYDGTGVILGEVHLARHYDTAIDWSYGYGDERITGDSERIPDLEGSAKIR